MIITRTPFRISFFGGGTDYPMWYKDDGGSVLSTTINKYCYISCRYLPPFFDYKYRIRYTAREETSTLSEIKHPAVRTCLEFLGIEQGIEMVHTSDLPARSGIGSSSAFTVGFLNSLYALTGQMVSKRKLALDAIHVEHDLIRENVGSQDQAAAAFGGFNKMTFGGEEAIVVQPVTISQEKLDRLQDHLLLFFTGLSRNASDVAKDQLENMSSRRDELKAMKQMVDEGIDILNGRVDAFDDFGRLLNDAWRVKRKLSKVITNGTIDHIYDMAIRAGALGGKLLGAGSGGFIVFYVLDEHRPKVREALADLVYVPFRFETLGSQIILYTAPDMSSLAIQEYRQSPAHTPERRATRESTLQAQG
jgi:D-glycero-alpha-D-manno-heptose-7-phosphate kinase